MLSTVGVVFFTNYNFFEETENLLRFTVKIFVNLTSQKLFENDII